MLVATERDEQTALVAWACAMAAADEQRYGCLRYLHASLGGERLRPGQAVRARQAGLRAGVPDLCLPVARGGYHGLWIEMKRPARPGVQRGRVSEDQARWIAWLTAQGYRAVVCHGAEAARIEIESYLSLPPPVAAPGAEQS